MLRKVFVPLLAALLAVVPSRTGSAFEVIEIAYDESVSADLSSDQTPGHATDLGLLGAGSHAVLLNDSEGNPSDRDHFTFEVGAGNELTEFRLSDYTHSDFGSNAAITLGTGQNPFQGSTVEAIIWIGSPSPLDLVLFDSAPGFQPSRDYVVSVSYQSEVGAEYIRLSITAVVAPVPEPGPGLLGMTAVLGLEATRRRRSN